MKSDTFCEYVKVCPTYGPGFFYIPGSDTCLKIGGNAHFEYMWIQPYTKSQDTQGTRSQGQITFDARNSSEYGLLRSFVSLGLAKRNGTEQSGSQEREGNATTNSNQLATSKQTFFNYQAYVQLGGFTAGRTASFAQAKWGFNDLVGAAGYDARDFVSTIAYTASLGNGISITGALEDGAESSRDGIFAATGAGAGAYSYYKLYSLNGGQSIAGVNKIPSINYGGDRIPDAVLSLDVDQAWGSAHLAASSHAINYGNVWTQNAQLLGTNATYVANTNATDFGYSVQGALKIKLDMIAAGDNIAVNGAYGKGFNSAVLRNVIGDRNGGDVSGIYGYNAGYNAAGTINDAVVNVATGQSYLATSYGAAGEFTHYFTPTVALFAGAGYAKLDYSAAAQAAGGAANVNPTAWTTAWVGAIWTPVKGFKVVPEAFYVTQTSKTAYAASVAEPATKTNDSWQGRLRVTRDF